MDKMYFILIAVSIFLGTGIATLITGIILLNNNRFGDSKGTYNNFSEHSPHVIQVERVL